MRNKKLSDLLFAKKETKPSRKFALAQSIKDYRSALFIYSCYLQENYLAMSTQIERYGVSEFFTDLANLLKIYYKEPLQRGNIYKDISTIYHQIID